MIHRNAAFTALCLGFFLIMMDTTSVPLLYTDLIDRFHVGPVAVAWIHNSYLIIFAGVLFLGGRLGDQFDRKAVVAAALILIAAGGLWAGNNRGLEHVIAGRMLMGAGAGLLAPQSMAYVSVLFARGGRGTALGIWGAIAGLATATGPVVTQTALALGDWRLVMWINVPVALLALFGVLLSLPSTSGNGFDTGNAVGSVMVGVALGAAILGLQIASEPGPHAMAGRTLAIIGAAGLASLIAHDIARGRALILPLELWHHRGFLRVCIISGLLGMGLTAFYLPLAYLLGQHFGLGPVTTSALMVTIALANAVVGPFAGYLSDRKTPERIVRIGLLAFAIACLGLGATGLWAPPGTVALVALFALMTLGGIGTGLAFAPLANLALDRAGMHAVGRATAFFNATRQALSALGGVLVAALFGALLRAQLGDGRATTIAALLTDPNAVAVACIGCFAAVAACIAAGSLLAKPQPLPAVQKPS